MSLARTALCYLNPIGQGGSGSCHHVIYDRMTVYEFRQVCMHGVVIISFRIIIVKSSKDTSLRGCYYHFSQSSLSR